MKEKRKVETLAEYLARGGTITVVKPAEREKQVDVVKQAAGGPAKLLTYDEAELYLSEIKQRKAPVKPKASSTLDLSALPEALRKKFIDRYEGVVDGEKES